MTQRVVGSVVIPFVLRVALPFPELADHGTHLFLVPEEGFSALVHLHDRLYAGALAVHLRPDFPFIPHITVGWKASAHDCKRLADQLNAGPLAIPGTVTALTIVAEDGGLIQPIGQIPLLRHRH